MRSLDRVDPVPEGSLVLHIGPPKTGTTTVQSALDNSRATLAAHGVDYPPRIRHPRSAYSAAAHHKVSHIHHPNARAQWKALATAVRTSPAARVVLSSEALAATAADRVRPAIDDLGRPTRVVITLRPLSALLSSRWQQNVKEQLATPYEAWLKQIFDTHRDKARGRKFWSRYRVDELVDRWAAVVGEENILVVALDPADRGLLLRTFESLLALPAGALVPRPGEANESMPYWTTELLRSYNARFNRTDLSRAYYRRSVHEVGVPLILASDILTQPRQPIVAPQWAVERANAIQAELNSHLRKTDIAVVGDLDRLVTTPSTEPTVERLDSVSIDAAVEFAHAMFQSAQDFHVRHYDRPADGLPLRRVDFTLRAAGPLQLAGALAGSLLPDRLMQAARTKGPDAVRRLTRGLKRRG
ncbi:MAG: sulfotransferase [Microbacterium sp.]|uniref:hypothetical protein n=1 Tax=Microbacterium sp. TaxID=51671 RepID=UPI0039E36ECC